MASGQKRKTEDGERGTENREQGTENDLMHAKSIALALTLALGAAAMAQAESARALRPGRAAIAEKLRELASSDPVKVAGAAYWLGEQGSAAVEAVPQLAGVLGDNRQVNPTRYRKLAGRATSTSPGEEAAAALAKIGEPAVETLITVLKTSRSAVARQNAAWALGVIQHREIG